MAFLEFHQAPEICLNRRVAAGEYLRPHLLQDELSGNVSAPAIEDILERAPRDEPPLFVA